MAIEPPTSNNQLVEITVKFFTRRKCVLVGAVLILLSLLLPYSHRELSALSDRFANLASVLGLMVSVVGFALTLWAVLETKRISQDAQRQIEREVAAARKETRQTVEKIALQLLQAECESIYRLLIEGRRAIRDGQWDRSAEKCQEAKQAIIRLGAYRQLESEEKLHFATGADDLQATIAFIERNRCGKGNPPTGLPNDKMQPLDTLLTLLERTRARLLQLFLESPYAN